MNDLTTRLKNNQIGIIPHDTIPGIIARMSEENANRIIDIKNRDQTKGFIILIFFEFRVFYLQIYFNFVKIRCFRNFRMPFHFEISE